MSPCKLFRLSSLKLNTETYSQRYLQTVISAQHKHDAYEHDLQDFAPSGKAKNWKRMATNSSKHRTISRLY
jgi:hypothetical protein